MYRYQYISPAQPRSRYRHAVATIGPSSWYAGTHPSTARALVALATSLGELRRDMAKAAIVAH